MVRNYYWGDQMAYLSIAASGTAGWIKDVEPFTETGVSIYPSGLYAFIGWFSKLTGLPPASSLNLLFAILSGLLVALLARSLQQLFGTVSAAFAALVPLLLGTLNTLVTGDWSYELSSHAVLWPMAAGLYAANAESLGLILICLVASYLTVRGANPDKTLFDRNLGWCAVFLGILANSHTYAFFVGMSIAIVFLLDEAISENHRQGLSGRSSNLLVLGATFFSLLLLMAILNISPLLRLLVLWFAGSLLIGFISDTPRKRLQFVVFLSISAVVATPQIIKIMTAFFTRNPFLATRQETSSALAIPVKDFFFQQLPLCFLVLGSLLIFKQDRSKNQFRAVLLLSFLWLFFSFNQVWGLRQEPYRFAIDAQVPLAIFSVATIFAGWKVFQSSRKVKLLATFGLALIFIPSLLEFHNFWNDRKNMGIIQLDSIQYQEMKSVASLAPRGLLLPDPCVEPAILKVISQKQISVYSKGLAWPDNVELVGKIVDARVGGVLDLDSAEKLGVVSVLVDNECPAQWGTNYSSHLKRVSPETPSRYELYKLKYE